MLRRKSSEGLRALAGMLGAVKRRVLAWIELFWGMELDYCYHVIMGIYRAYIIPGDKNENSGRHSL